MIFVRLWYRNDVSQFPHVWDGVGVEGKIESVGEVCETEWPNVLKVSDANAIRSCGVVVFCCSGWQLISLMLLV